MIEVSFISCNVFHYCPLTTSPTSSHHVLTGNLQIQIGTDNDGQFCGVELPPGDAFENYSEYVQVCGKVSESDDGYICITVQRTNSAGVSVDLDAYNKTLKLAHGKYSSLFL